MKIDTSIVRVRVKGPDGVILEFELDSGVPEKAFELQFPQKIEVMSVELKRIVKNRPVTG